MLQRTLSLLVLLSLFATCSTDFEVEADWKNIPIVYGFLSIQDTAHYLRIEKAFLQPGGDANAIARIADSLYYAPDDVIVSLENLRSGTRVIMQRVDGADEGYPRTSGPFAEVPNILYKASRASLDLRGGDRVRLNIDRGEGLPPATAETTVLRALTADTRRPADPARIADYNRDLTIVWSAGEEAEVYDLRMIIKYREFLASDPIQNSLKTLQWDIAKGVTSEDNRVASYETSNRNFFLFLASNIPVDDNVIRNFEGFDLIIAAGGEELGAFQRISDANTGLTSSQQIPIYTNISEGRGVFTSRYVLERDDIQLDLVSQDSLRDGFITRQLNFQ